MWIGEEDAKNEVKMRACIAILGWSWRIDLLLCAKTGIYTQYTLYIVPAYIESLAFPNVQYGG